MKKRVCALLLVFCMFVGTAGCGKPQPEAPSGPQGHSDVPQTENGDTGDGSIVSYDGEMVSIPLRTICMSVWMEKKMFSFLPTAFAARFLC